MVESAFSLDNHILHIIITSCLVTCIYIYIYAYYTYPVLSHDIPMKSLFSMVKSPWNLLVTPGVGPTATRPSRGACRWRRNRS